LPERLIEQTMPLSAFSRWNRSSAGLEREILSKNRGLFSGDEHDPAPVREQNQADYPIATMCRFPGRKNRSPDRNGMTSAVTARQP